MTAATGCNMFHIVCYILNVCVIHFMKYMAIEKNESNFSLCLIRVHVINKFTCIFMKEIKKKLVYS